jgi:hypothetical protein
MGDHNKERNDKDDDSVLHILSDLAKGQNEMNETFAKGQRELIDTLTQLLSPLGNILGLNTNAGNGQTRFHAEGSNSGALDNGQNRSQAEGSNSHMSRQSVQLTTSGRTPRPLLPRFIEHQPAQQNQSEDFSTYFQEYMALRVEFQAAMSLHDYCNIKYRNRPREGPRGAPGQQQNADLRRKVGKLSIPSYDGSSRYTARSWVQKLDTYLQLNPMTEVEAIKFATLHLDWMKEVMSTCPVLALPDFSQPFVLECDTSGQGIGAVLMQNKHPIAFESRKLGETDRLLSIYDKETLAIMHVLAKFRQYLVGGHFVVKTDHNSLKHFLEQKDLSERQQKWVSKVQAYDFDIEYVKGKNNVIADALSRRPTAFARSEIAADWKSLLLVEYSKNAFARELIDGSIQDGRYTVVYDIVYYKGRIYLVPESTLKEKILRLRAVHDTPLAGHPRYLKTYRQGRERFSWKGLKGDVLLLVCEGVLDLSAEQV